MDFSSLRRLLIRVGKDFGTIPADPRDARPLLSEYRRLDDEGDGIRSYVGIITAFVAAKRPLMLIDEPEAFLHPPQAYRIGEYIASQAKEGCQAIVATHSVDVLRGILAQSNDVNIVRIDRVGDRNFFHILDIKELKKLVADPLLGSARVLDGLFYGGAVVVEADSDARLYQLVSRKCQPDADIHFVNAGGKQAVPRILGIYRSMGIRCAGIVDFDVLNKRTEFLDQITGIGLEESQHGSVTEIRDEIAKEVGDTPPDERLSRFADMLDEIVGTTRELQQQPSSSDAERRIQIEKGLTGVRNRVHELADVTKPWRTYKQRGREALSNEFRERFDQLFKVCASGGLFINPCGELESVLSEYGVQHSTDKRRWLPVALGVLGGLAVDTTKYPWCLIQRVHDHISRAET